MTTTSCGLQGFPEEEGSERWRKPRVTLRHVEGSPSHSGTLKEAGVAEADAVIVGSAYSKDGKEVCVRLSVSEHALILPLVVMLCGRRVLLTV